MLAGQGEFLSHRRPFHDGSVVFGRPALGHSTKIAQQSKDGHL